MDTIFIPTENDFRRWVKEAVKEYLQETALYAAGKQENDEGLLNRKEIAKFLRISLVTLTDWIKRGLPSHRQRGRVYFDKAEVIKYIKENKIGQLKFGSRFKRFRQEIA
jgi:predicted DNA-binding transcriptional regulator AlpA